MLIRRLLVACGVAVALLGAVGCSDRELEIDAELFEELDTDEDGVVSRTAVTQAEADATAEAERVAQEARLEAEQAERDEQQAAREAAYAEFVSEPDNVAASFPGGQLTVSQVQASIVDSPSTMVEDPQNPTQEQFVARLSSMLQLRVAAVALNGFGFEVDLDGTDDEINTEVEAHIGGEFEEFAQQRSIEDDPSIARLATPHCVSVLVTAREPDVVAAAERVSAGEALGDVAAEMNLEGVTNPDGGVGCANPFDLFGQSQLSMQLLELEVGGLSEPVMQPSAASPTGELWVVLHLDELRDDEADLTTLGPFSGRLLADTMVTYEVTVAPELGNWNASELRINIPLLP